MAFIGHLHPLASTIMSNSSSTYTVTILWYFEALLIGIILPQFKGPFKHLLLVIIVNHTSRIFLQKHHQQFFSGERYSSLIINSYLVFSFWFLLFSMTKFLQLGVCAAVKSPMYKSLGSCYIEGLGCGYKYMTIVRSQNHRFHMQLSEINSPTRSELLSHGIEHVWLWAEHPSLRLIVVFCKHLAFDKVSQELLLLSEFMT